MNPKSDRPQFPSGKTSPPQTGSGLISRERLVNSLVNTARDKALVLVVAPAGYGKTVLLAQVYQRMADAGSDVAWYNCDRSDVVPQKLSAFLRSHYGTSEDLGADDNLGLEASAGMVANALALELEQSGKQFTVFFENYHLAQSPETNALIEALLTIASPSLHLIISSRSRPSFASRKLAIAGQVEELRVRDLAFTDDEFDALARLVLPQVRQAELAGVLDRTEGWPLAIRLFLLALGKGADRKRLLDEMTEREADVLDYLTEEVLGGQPAALQEFLVASCFLDQINADLCSTILPESDCPALLLEAGQNGLFLARIEPGSEWWRYHPIFKQCLLSHFERLPKDRQAAMHRTASQWFEENGLIAEAVDMAINAGDATRAATLLGRLAPELVSVRGDLATFLQLLARLPPSLVAADPALQFWQAWAMFFARKYRDAARLVTELHRIDEASGETGVGTELRRQIGLLDILVATFTDDMATARRVSAEWLGSYPQADPFDRATVACGLVLANLAFLDLSSARRTYEVAQRAIAESNSAYGIAWVCGIGMTMDLVAGEPLNALARLDGLRSGLSHASQAPSNITSTLDFLAAAASYHLGRIDEASDALLGGSELLAEHGVSETASFGLAASLRVEAKTNGVTSALALAQRLEALLVQSYAPRLLLALRYERVLMLFRAGRQEEAIDEAAAISDVQPHGERRRDEIEADLPSVRELRQIVAARTAIAEGTWNEALRLLTGLASSARHGARHLRFIQAQLLKAATHYGQGDPVKAVRTFLDAVTVASPRGLFQIFLDDELLCRPLVAAALAGRDTTSVAQDDDFRFLLKLGERFGIDVTSSISNEDILAPLEPLTARETAMIELLLLGMRNREIAERLSTSEATVKWHLYNLYSKLGVNNRTAAIHRARALGLGSA